MNVLYKGVSPALAGGGQTADSIMPLRKAHHVKLISCFSLQFSICDFWLVVDGGQLKSRKAKPQLRTETAGAVQSLPVVKVSKCFKGLKHNLVNF